MPGVERRAAVQRALALEEHLARRAVDPPLGTAPALALVLVPRPEIGVLVRPGFPGRLGGGLDRQAVGEHRVVAVRLGDVAAHVLGVVRHPIGEHVLVQVEVDRLLLRRRDVLVAREPVGRHLVEHDVPALDRELLAVDRRVQRRRLREPRDHRGLGERELIEVLLEIPVRGGTDAPRAGAEVDVIEVDREDRPLGILGLEAAREDRLLALARQALLAAEELLRDLLRDRRAALREVARGDVRPHRARDALEVDPAVVEEVVILDREERIDQALRDPLVRDELAPLLRELAEQGPVGRVHPGHRRGRPSRSGAGRAAPAR